MKVLIFVLLLSIIIEDIKVSAENDTSTVGSLIPKLEQPKYHINGSILWFPRIIGGSPAQKGELSGKVSLQTFRGSHMCGATLINPNHILTAAHCSCDDRGKVIEPSEYRVMGDDLSIAKVGSKTRQVRFISHIFVHLSFSIKTLANDIAVMRLKDPFIFTSTFYPVKLSTSAPMNGQSCQVFGWGTTTEDGDVSVVLQKITIEILNMKECNGKTSYNGAIPDGSLCAGNKLGGKDSCQGDSGGGLICANEISGVVSWGYGCGRKNFPGIYAISSRHNNWITSTLEWNGGSQDNVPKPTTISPNFASKIFVSPYVNILSVIIIVYLRFN